MPSELGPRRSASRLGGGVGRYILVVDDDEAFLHYTSDLLERAGFECRQIPRGMEALAVARDERPLLVILDVKLPDLSGYEVCRELREELGEELPIIFVSGERTEAYDRTAGFLLGGDDYLVKPFEPDDLLARVRRWTARSTYKHTRASDGGPIDLTRREFEVLRLIAAGLGSAAIARRLVISTKTVSSHVQRVLAKLGAHSRGEAVAAAYRERLIDPAEVAAIESDDEASARLPQHSQGV
ncbi:MAG TPA: response regulator transcription factor [Gaiellaceae bacterium]|nr:response regulator transcription factor [Gaiellaceae bacterium]HET8651116.1 response regulator transcription factor [Gaiellaceae bacterium]